MRHYYVKNIIAAHNKLLPVALALQSTALQQLSTSPAATHHHHHHPIKP
jgi:hypothetical protein